MSLSQKKRMSFYDEYERITLLQNMYPLPYIMSTKGENYLNLNVDRISQNEWLPILEALRKDKTLKYVSLTSSWQRGKVKGLKKIILYFFFLKLILNSF